MNIEQVLTRLNIDSTSRLLAVQQVREQVEASDNPILTAKHIINNLTVGDVFETNDPIAARMTAAYLVEDAIVLGEKYNSTIALNRAAQKIAEHRLNNPWFFHKPESATVETTTETRQGVVVEVKTDGKLKKGGKQILAQAIFDKNKTLSNQELVNLFMTELSMSKAGATTYVYNCKKASGMTSEKRGRKSRE